MKDALQIELPIFYQDRKLRQHEQRSFIREMLNSIRDSVEADDDELKDTGAIICLLWNEIEGGRRVMSMLTDDELVFALAEASDALVKAKAEIADLKKTIEGLTGLNEAKPAAKRKRKTSGT